MAIKNQAIDNFIESWGVMGSVWGINASTARVHALLIVSSNPLSLDDISSRLNISRGNASMCLKELRNWNVIKLIKKSGDRRDYYISESDAWKMLFAIARERKRREFDPLVETVENTIKTLSVETEGMDIEVYKRLERIDELLGTMKLLAERFLKNEALAQSVLPLMMKFTKKKNGED